MIGTLDFIKTNRKAVGFSLLLLMAVAYWAATGGQAKAGEATRLVPISFADVAQKASPSVVNISSVKRTSGGPGGMTMPFGDDEEMKDFFEHFFGPQTPQRERKIRGQGSGFIIDPSGLILTNNHVVENTDEIMAKMSDGKEYKAQILGRDPKTDLALLKIEAGTLPSLTLGSSGDMRVGDWAVAIGNPFGLEHTVTAGILSAKGRVIGAGPYDDFLQTDASINPGNSGGPLLNLAGEVIGINTAIISGGTGIGFAIPIDLAKEIVNQLKNKGKVVRSWLGVMIQKVTPELAKSLGLKSEAGALVADVTSGGPAEKAGIIRGDVIVSFNGQAIKDSNRLPVLVAASPTGSAAEIKLMRDGKEKTVSLKLEEMPEDRTAGLKGQAAPKVGLTVKAITPEMALKLGLSENEGVLITGVASGGPAAEAGLKPGDVILEMNREKMTGLSAYNNAISRIQSGNDMLFLIKRGKNTLYFTVRVQ